MYTVYIGPSNRLLWMRALQRNHTHSLEDLTPSDPGAGPGLDGAENARAQVAPKVRRILDSFILGNVGSHLLRRAHFVAEDLFAQEFANESLTPRQKAALVTVYRNPGLSQNALADRLYMDRNTAAAMVKRMVDANMLQRIAARSDHRAYELFLAPKGAQVLNRVMPRDASVEARLLERLPEEYRLLFIKCLHLMVDGQAQKSD